MKNLLYYLFGLLFVVCILSCSTKVITCDDVKDGILIHEKVVVQRNPERQFKAAIKGLDASLKGSIDILNKINLNNIQIGVKQDVVELRQKFDQFSGRTQEILKASYGALQTTPCDKAVREKNQKLISDIARESSALEELKTSLAYSISLDSSVKISSEIKKTIEHYDAQKAETVFDVSRYSKLSQTPVNDSKKDELDLSKMQSRWWTFDDEPNSALRLTEETKNYQLYPSSSSFDCTSLDLNKDFVFEVRARSMKPDFGEYGMIINYKVSSRDIVYRLKINQKKSNVVLSARSFSDSNKKDLFSTTQYIDPTKYHCFQIKKSGETLSFFFDSKKLAQSNLYRIESNGIKLFINGYSDVLYDYVQYYF